MISKDNVVKEIRNAILSGRWKQGEKLIEKDICKEMKISRTPFREAIGILSMEGLIKSIPNRGSYVIKLTIKDIKEIYDLRILLESEAFKLATPYLAKVDFDQLELIHRKIDQVLQKQNFDLFEQYNNEFHSSFFKKCPNERLIEIIDNLKRYIRLLRLNAIIVPGRAEIIMNEHEEIIEFAKKGNTEKVYELTKKHLVNARDTLINYRLLQLNEYDDYTSSFSFKG